MTACATDAPQNVAQTTTKQAAKPTKTVSNAKSQSERFAEWKRGFIAEAIAKKYSKDLVKSVIGPAKINPKAIHKDRNQPESVRQIWEYLDGVARPERVQGGQDKLAENADLLAQIEARYPVNRHILTAIWGLESAYGKIQGHDNMIDSLVTLGFDGRREKFAKQQLYAILDLLVRGDVRKEQLVGSWAGAMGQTQFIPTTFRDYAVDFDGNGNKDLWQNNADALGSTANYLTRHGWRKGEPVVVEVKLPDGFDYSLLESGGRTVTGWAGFGIVPIGRSWSREDLFLHARLLLPAGRKGPAFLTFKNFAVIKRYNNSTSYAMGVHALAELFQGKTPIVQDWPRGDKALTFAQRKALQRALTRQGYTTGGVDGMIGPNSRKALRAWQRAHGLPADGYANLALLKKIIAAQ